MSIDLAARAVAARALKAVEETHGASAYQVALANGYVGSEAEWLASLRGAPGGNGKDGEAGQDGAHGASAYELAVAAGFVGTPAQWLASIRGAAGGDGDPGPAGKSAYQLAVLSGFVGSESDWLASLRGPPGPGADPQVIADLQADLAAALARIAMLETPDVLTPLTIDHAEVDEDAVAGDLVGLVSGFHPYETFEQTVTAGGRLLLVDGEVRAGATGFDYLTAQFHDIEVHRTLAKPGMPLVERTDVIRINVTTQIPPIVVVDRTIAGTGVTDLALTALLTGPDNAPVTIELSADAPPLRYFPAN